MSSNRVNPTPLIGRAGVVLVAADIAAGALVLPVAALLREFVIPRDVPLAAPEQINELGRLALWVSAALAGALWPIALRAVDPGYPSAQLPIRRVLVAATTWLLSVSGAIYLLDKNLESRALVVIATLLLLSVALLVRRSNHTGSPDKLGPESPLPSLGAEAEAALVRGEPISISLHRLKGSLARPTIVYEGERIWIYPSALSPSERLTKRLLDILLASALILALSPLILVVALLVFIRDGRPIIYSDARAGLYGRPFSVRKFRTMRVGADAERAALWDQRETKGPAFKIAADPRITPLGRVLRKYSLDELPQLFDVVAGRMSLVGPRPAGLDELTHYEDRHRLRLTVRPGVTGLWQVRRKIDEDFEQRMSDDLEYIQRWSILLDLSIVLRTVRVVLSGRGV